MSEIKRLLAVRKALKDRKPAFIRQEFGKFKKIKAKWTRPKGHHAKMRERRKGNMRMVLSGWRSPTAVRGLHRSGLARVLVATSAVLAGVDPKTQGIIVSSAVGAKKRLQILAEAQKAGVTVLNIRDGDAYAKRVEAERAAVKAASVAAAKAKEQRAAQPEKATIETLTDEEKKKAEKAEKDKVLTQKG